MTMQLASRCALVLSGAAGIILLSLHNAGATETAAAALAAPPDICPLEAQLIRNGLVDVQSLDPSIMVDLKYAKPDNFMGVDVYAGLTRAYLRPKAAKKLARANQLLRERHPSLRILVCDAFRPRSVQRKMWQIVSDTPMRPYVANPRAGSIHNYGAAVDVTLFDVEAEARLDMGTPVDHFGPLAQPRLEHQFLRQGKLTQRQLDNRRVLRDTMLDAGWYLINVEWWHFNALPRKQVQQEYSIIE